MKKNYVKRILSEKEWLEARKSSIGGSEAAAMFDASKWVNTNDLYNKFIYGKEKKVAKNERIIEGTIAENSIRKIFSLNFSKEYKVINPPSRKKWMFNRIDKPYMSVTPDGLLKDLKTGDLLGLEIKDIEVRSKENEEEWKAGNLPQQYFWQCIQYMAVIEDLKGVILFAHLKHFNFFSETTFAYSYSIDKPYVILRDDVKDFIQALIERETEFYEVNIKGRVRPAMKI